MKKIFITTGFLFLSTLIFLNATERTPDALELKLIKYKIGEAKKEKPNMTFKESKNYLDSLILDQIKVKEAKRQGIDTSFVYLNKVAEYSYQLANQNFFEKITKNSIFQNRIDSIEYLHIYHIYQPIPQQANSSQFEQKIALFDSIYSYIKSNPSQMENCVITCSEIKEPVWIRQRQDVVEFDSKVLPLSIGEISEPFFTPSGVHIVKVIDKKKFPKKMKNNDWKSLTLTNFDLLLSAIKQLNKFSYEYEVPWKTSFWQPNSNQVLFTLNDKIYTKSDFDFFAKNNLGTVSKQYIAFVLKSIFDEQYFNLLESDKSFEYSLIEYKYNLLLEELTRREIEKLECEDDAGLERFFNEHKKKYKLDFPRFQGVVVFCSNRRVARGVKKILRKNNKELWLALLKKKYGEYPNQFIQVQEGPFVIGSNACIDKKVFKQGNYALPSSYSRLVTKGEVEWYPGSYLDVKDRVIVDYKEYLKKKWEEDLIKNNYIEINLKDLKTVNIH